MEETKIVGKVMDYGLFINGLGVLRQRQRFLWYPILMIELSYFFVNTFINPLIGYLQPFIPLPLNLPILILGLFEGIVTFLTIYFSLAMFYDFKDYLKNRERLITNVFKRIPLNRSVWKWLIVYVVVFTAFQLYAHSSPYQSYNSILLVYIPAILPVIILPTIVDKETQKIKKIIPTNIITVVASFLGDPIHLFIIIVSVVSFALNFFLSIILSSMPPTSSSSILQSPLVFILLSPLLVLWNIFGFIGYAYTFKTKDAKDLRKEIESKFKEQDKKHGGKQNGKNKTHQR